MKIIYYSNNDPYNYDNNKVLLRIKIIKFKTLKNKKMKYKVKKKMNCLYNMVKDIHIIMRGSVKLFNQLISIPKSSCLRFPKVESVG